MANWCVFEVRISGGTEAERKQLAAEENEKVQWHAEHGQWLHDSEDQDNWWYWPDYPARLQGPDRRPFTLDTDTGELYMGWAERKWRLPLDWIEELSRRYPDMTFATRYYVQQLWDAGTLVTDGGHTRRTELDVGYFFTARTAPIHHYAVAVCGESEKIRKDCIKAGYAVAGHEYGYNLTEMATRDPDTLQSYVSSKYGLSCHWLPMTLDEETYLGSLTGQATERTAAQLIDVCARNITLTPAEFDYLAENLLPFATDRGLDYWSGKWTIPNPMPGRLKNYERHPLPAELLCLMEWPTTTKGRWRELQAALNTPRWRYVWPMWEIREGERQQAMRDRKQQPAPPQEPQAPPSQGTMLPDEEFLKALEPEDNDLPPGE